MAIVLALLAGLSYAGASVLQQRVASEQRPELSLRPALLLARRRRALWLLGIALDIGAYGLEAGALATGTVVTVAPLLVSGLLFALPLSTIGHGATRHPARVDPGHRRHRRPRAVRGRRLAGGGPFDRFGGAIRSLTK